MKKITFYLVLFCMLLICKMTFSQQYKEFKPVKYLASDKSSADEFQFDDQNENAIMNDLQTKSSGESADQDNFNPFKSLAMVSEKFDNQAGNDVRIYTTGSEAVAGSKNVVLCIMLKQPSQGDYMIPLDLSGSTVKNGIDFVKIPEYVLFKKGEQNQCLIINPSLDKNAISEGVLKIRARTSETTYSDLQIKIKNNVNTAFETLDK